MNADDIRKKWEKSGLLNGLNLNGLNSNTASTWNTIQFPKIIGTEPAWHKKKKDRYKKLKNILGDDEFFKIVDKKKYKDFLEEKFLPPTTTIMNDLVAVQPLSAPNLQLCYMDFKYGDDNDNF